MRDGAGGLDHWEQQILVVIVQEGLMPTGVLVITTITDLLSPITNLMIFGVIYEIGVDVANALKFFYLRSESCGVQTIASCKQCHLLDVHAS